MTEKIILNLIILLFIIPACNNAGSKVVDKSNKTQQQQYSVTDKKHITIENFNEKKLIAIGQKLVFSINILHKNPKLDSILIYVEGKVKERYYSDINTIKINTNNLKLGKKFIRISSFYSNKTRQDNYFEYFIISDIIPQNYNFEIIKTYKHDIKAYTQGLVWENGIIYEGTGQWGTSSLRKIDLNTQEILQSVNLENKIFGEGICIFNDKIYQLTWQSNKGFIYQKSNFKLLQDFNYFTEGWGLTTDGENLIMSDGSNILYFLNPEYFTEEKRIEVYNDRGPENMLNELEYIDGLIYANIYGKEYIVIIDANSGKVLGKINAEKLWPENTPKDKDHALNGIAYNSNNKNLLITGKLWPIIYEIKVIP